MCSLRALFTPWKSQRGFRLRWRLEARLTDLQTYSLTYLRIGRFADPDLQISRHKLPALQTYKLTDPQTQNYRFSNLDFQTYRQIYKLLDLQTYSFPDPNPVYQPETYAQDHVQDLPSSLTFSKSFRAFSDNNRTVLL